MQSLFSVKYKYKKAVNNKKDVDVVSSRRDDDYFFIYSLQSISSIQPKQFSNQFVIKRFRSITLHQLFVSLPVKRSHFKQEIIMKYDSFKYLSVRSKVTNHDLKVSKNSRYNSSMTVHSRTDKNIICLSFPSLNILYVTARQGTFK